MYLTIGLIVLLPIGARIYRRMVRQQTERMLREQFGKSGGNKHEPNPRS